MLFFAPLRMSPSALTAIMTLSSSASNEIRFDTLCFSLSLSGSQREGDDGPGACASSGITGWFDDGEGLQSALRDSLRFAAERNCWGGGETEEDMRAATGQLVLIRNFHAFIACPAVEPTWRSNDKSFSVDNADRLPFLGLAIEPLQRIASHSIQFLSLKSSPQRIADSRSAFSMGRLLRVLFTRHGSLNTKLLMISLEIDTLTRLGQFLFSFLFSRSRARVRLLR